MTASSGECYWMVVSKASGVEISGTIATVMREDGYFPVMKAPFEGDRTVVMIS